MIDLKDKNQEIKFIYNQLADMLMISYNAYNSLSPTVSMKKDEVLKSYDKFFVKLLINEFNKYDELNALKFFEICEYCKFYDEFKTIKYPEDFVLNVILDKCKESDDIPEFFKFILLIDKLVNVNKLNYKTSFSYVVYKNFKQLLLEIFGESKKEDIKEDLYFIYDYIINNLH